MSGRSLPHSIQATHECESHIQTGWLEVQFDGLSPKYASDSEQGRVIPLKDCVNFWLPLFIETG